MGLKKIYQFKVNISVLISFKVFQPPTSLLHFQFVIGLVLPCTQFQSTDTFLIHPSNILIYRFDRSVF